MGRGLGDEGKRWCVKLRVLKKEIRGAL